MRCPIDESELAITERQGIEIDYCPKCRGVWLDRGELDKLIERSATAVAPQSHPDPARPPKRGEDYRDRERDEYYRKKRKKSLLGEIFDF